MLCTCRVNVVCVKLRIAAFQPPLYRKFSQQPRHVTQKLLLVDISRLVLARILSWLPPLDFLRAEKITEIALNEHFIW